MKAFCKLMPVFTLFCLPVCALCQGHPNASVDRVPKDVLCMGIPDYPKGANLELPNTYVGNLQDGFNTSYQAGADGVLVFMLMTLTKSNTLEGEFLKIDGLSDVPPIPMAGPDKGKGQGTIVKLSAFHGKTTCTVKSWYK
jgi:hypothetical protein